MTHSRPSRRVVEIECRGEYTKKHFRAVLSLDGGPGVVLAESELFEWRPKRPVEATRAAVAAHQGLVDHLNGLGWELEGQGEYWFARRFRDGRQRAV